VLGVVSRFRVLVVAFSIAVFVFLFGFANLCYVPWSVGWLRFVDLAFWVLSIGSVFAGFAEFWLFWRRCSALSTLLIDVAGLGIVVFARFSSAIYSLLKTSFYVQVVGGSIVDEVSYRLASLAILGNFMILSSTSLSTWFREPVVFAKGLTFHDLFIRLVRVLGAANIRWVYIASFAVGFLARFYPELKYLGLPIGWDTLEYIAVARDFTSVPRFLTSYLWLGGWRNLPPLITWVSGSLALLGVDPWTFFKVYPATAVGLISMLSAAIVYRVSGSRAIALASALLTVFNPFILGQSQQWQRHLLGLVLLMAYLYLCESKAKPLYRALALVLGALAYEPVAVLALFLSVAEVLMVRGGRGKAVFTASAILALLALLWYVGFPQKPVASLAPSGVYVAGNIEYSPATALSYTITCLLLLAPSIVIANIWRSIDTRTKTAIALLFTAFIMPVLCVAAPVDQHRWFLALLTIVTPYTVAGLAKMNRNILALVTALVVLLGSAYPFTENGFTHFRIWAKTSIAPASGYPWKLEPAIKNLSDVMSIAGVVAMRKEVTLVSLGMYPQLHLFIRNPTNIAPLGVEPALITAIAYIATNNLSKMITVTSINMSKELEIFREKPDLYNTTLALQLGEKYKQMHIDIENVRIELLYRGTTSNIYTVEINKAK
jgi:hypothetical protein